VFESLTPFLAPFLDLTQCKALYDEAAKWRKNMQKPENEHDEVRLSFQRQYATNISLEYDFGAAERS